MLGTTLVAAAAPWVNAQAGATAARALDTAVKWGGQLIKLTPWGRAASVVVGAGVLAYEKGWLDRWLPQTLQSKPVSHSLLGPPPELRGRKEEFLAADNNRPTLLDGAPLPQELQGVVLEGYETPQRFDQFSIHGGSGGRIDVLPMGGFAAGAIPAPDHILLQTDESAGARPELAQRPGMAQYQNAPEARVNFSQQVVVHVLGRSGITIFSYKFPAPKGADVVAEVDGTVVDGVMKFRYLSVGDSQLRPSGTDLFIHAVHALEKNGIAVHVVRDKWDQSKQLGDNTKRFDQALYELGVTRQTATHPDLLHAAAQTHTGRMVHKFGLSPVWVHIEPASGNVLTHFENLELAEKYGPHNEGR